MDAGTRTSPVSQAAALALAAALSFAACAGAPTPSPSLPPGSPGGGIELARSDVPRASADPSDAAPAGAAISAFGLDLYRAVTSEGPNVVVSPASIALALAMARAGALGQTASEMDAVMRSVASEDHAAWLNALDAALAARSGTFRDAGGNDLAVTLRIANAAFAQRGMSLEPAYLEALASRFGSGVHLVDYIGATEQARLSIDRWVDGQTEHRIPELLGPGVLDRDSRLTLVDAIYLKAPWATPFSVEATKPAPFTRADGSTVAVPTMETATEMRYAEGAGWQAVEIPYIGGSLAMLVVVPGDLATFEASLTADGLGRIVSGLEEAQVDLTLPRFSIETKAELADLLSSLGMPTAFDPDRADFSAITKETRLVISAVVHQANIDVDEKGTEAAAATAVALRATSLPPREARVHVDRPFLFALRDVPTGTILFLGRVADPSVTR